MGQKSIKVTKILLYVIAAIFAVLNIMELVMGAVMASNNIKHEYSIGITSIIIAILGLLSVSLAIIGIRKEKEKCLFALSGIALVLFLVNLVFLLTIFSLEYKIVLDHTEERLHLTLMKSIILLVILKTIIIAAVSAFLGFQFVNRS